MSASPADHAKQFSDLAEGLSNASASLGAQQARLQEALAQKQIIDKQIETSGLILADLDDQIIQVTKEHQSKVDAQRSDYSDLLEQIAKRNIILQELDASYAALKSEVTILKEELTEVEVNIRDRKLYLNEQEVTINQTVDAWNEHLTDIKRQASELNNNKSKSLEELLKLETEIDGLKATIISISSKAEELDNNYEVRAETYRDKLRGYESQITTKQTLLNELDIQQTQREQSLATREKAIKLREIVASKTDRELQQRERKLKMDQGLAGHSWTEKV